LNVSVVIPAYGLCPQLSEVVGAVLDQTTVPGEIIVAHSGEHDPTEQLQSLDERIRVIHSDPGLLAGAARNLGVEKSCGKWVAFVDADVVPRRDWLAELLAGTEVAQTDFVVGAIDCASPGGYWGRCLWVVEFGSVHPYLPSREIESGASANMMAPLGAIKQGSGFAVDFQGGEDTKLHASMRQRGLRLRFCPSAVVRHYNVPGFHNCIRHLRRLGFGSGYVRTIHGNLRGSVAARHPVLSVGLWLSRFVLISFRILRWGGDLRIWYPILAPGILIGVMAWNIGFFAGAREGRPGEAE
jgi:glycosyltransferase involved in cell wall biosynthesis